MLSVGLVTVGVLSVFLEVAYYWAKCEALYNRYEGRQDESI